MIARPDALYGERGGRRSSAGRPFKIFEISPTITHPSEAAEEAEEWEEGRPMKLGVVAAGNASWTGKNLAEGR